MRPAVLLLACVLLAGCGSDDGDSGVREYRDRGERLCREAERDAERLADRVGDDVEGTIPSRTAA